jgi:hypothetical protein
MQPHSTGEIIAIVELIHEPVQPAKVSFPYFAISRPSLSRET